MRSLLLLALCTVAFTARAQPVLIVSTVPLQDDLQYHAQTVVESIPRDTSTLGQHEVVLALTGVGKTNSALVVPGYIAFPESKI